MKNYLCPNCGRQMTLSVQGVNRHWMTRGYKFEGWMYTSKCPHCYATREVPWVKLPFKVKCHFLFHKKRQDLRPVACPLVFPFYMDIYLDYFKNIKNRDIIRLSQKKEGEPNAKLPVPELREEH